MRHWRQPRRVRLQEQPILRHFLRDFPDVTAVSESHDAGYGYVVAEIQCSLCHRPGFGEAVQNALNGWMRTYQGQRIGLCCASMYHYGQSVAAGQFELKIKALTLDRLFFRIRFVMIIKARFPNRDDPGSVEIAADPA